MLHLSLTQIDLGMRAALKEAALASARGEVPVGAALMSPLMSEGSEIIATAGNRVEELNDATAHAELLVIRAASAGLRGWRLDQHALFVTLEPCTMCIGAIRNSRIGAIVFGAYDPRAGAVGSLYDISLDERLGVVPRVISGISAVECAELLKNFFAQRRS